MQPHGKSDTGVDAGRNDAVLKRAEPARSRVRLLAARGLAALLLAFAALLALPLQAQAQTEVWSGTLTVRNNSGVLGCSNGFANNFCSVHLSDDDFRHASTDYAITLIFLRTNGRLELTFDTDLATATQGLTLNVDGTAFAFEDADTQSATNRSWNSTSLSWSAGGTVSLTLTEPAASTVSIGAETDGTGDAEGVEGDTIELTVKLSAVSAGAVTGKWRYVSGTARSADYGHDGNQNLTIAAGDTTATVNVDLIDDDKYEGEESFEIELYDFVGATIDRSRAQITIDVDSNNPDLPSFRVDPTTVDVNEDNGTVTVNVVHDGFAAQDDDITITYQTDDGTATEPDDYTATSGTLTFPAGSKTTRTVTIPIVNDADEEDDETFKVEFGTPSVGAFDSGGARATVTIEANDTASTVATLSGLALKNASDDSTITLSPSTFVSTTKSYTADVATDVDEITVEPASDHNATFAYLNASDAALTDADTGKTGFQAALAVGANTIKVKVTAEDGNATDTYTVVVTRAAAGNTLATGKPSITGAAQAGMTLRVGLGDIADADGLPASGYTYQWIRGGSDLLGATGSSLTLSSNFDYGQKLRVRVSFMDDAGFLESRTSDATLPVAPAATACPTDAATVWCARLTVGHLLEEQEGDIVAVQAGYEARSGRAAYGSVSGATFRHLGVDYTVTSLHGGATQDLYFATTPNLPADGAGLTVHVQKFVGELDVPLAEGVFQSHDTLWFFQGALNTSVGDGDTLSDAPLIHAPFGRDLVVPHPPDPGTKVRVRLSYAAPTGPATGVPEITGTIEVGETLTADTSRIADGDGLTSVSYSYQWIRVDGTTESNITGATESTYTLVAADEGKGIRVKVSFNDDAGNPETLASDVYRAVALLPAPRLPAVDDPNAIWMATLTVADLGSNQYGYEASQGGGLTDTAFTYLGDDTPLSGGTYQEVGTLYTIDELSYHASGGQIVLSLDGEFVGGSAANIFVDVGGTQRSFSQGTYSSGPHTYTFTFPDPFWTGGEEVTVKIVALAETNGPQDLAATSAVSGDQFDVELTWTAPTSGGTVTGYRVEHQPDPALQWRTLAASQSGTTYTDSGLGRGTVRYYRVAALRSGGASYSEIVRAQAASETQEVPEKVNHVDVKPAEGSDTALEVAWNRPRTPLSRAPATGYHVQYAQHDGAAPAWRDGEDWATVTFPRWMERLPWRTWSGAVEEIEFEESTERSPHLKTVVTGLAPGTNYRVRVRGCTEAGCGEWSYPRRWRTSGATLNATEAEPLTATLEDFPVNHDGSGAFTFRIAFSAEVTISPQDMKDHALVVAGGTVTNATGVDGRKDLWELTLEPAGSGPVSILAPQDRACTETGALCTAEGMMLSTGLGHSVPGPAPSPQNQQALAPLAAAFVAVPAEHDGETEFWLELSFDAAVVRGSKSRIRALLGVTGGSVTRLRRKDGRLDHWRIRIQPSSHEAVTVTLSPSPACGATGAVCTEDGRTFTTALATRIQGPPGLTVADAEVEEGPNAVLSFSVTLSRAPSSTVTVDYATADGTATAGSDYTAVSGALTFAAGETEKTVSVAVLDDAHDEGSETLTLTLSNATGAYIEDGTATGTINNTDHMPKAWLARFGRTVAEQVLDAVGARVEGNSNSPGPAQLTLGGHQVVLDASWSRAEDTLLGEAGVLGQDLRETRDLLRAEADASPAREVSTAGLLMASSFHMASAGGEGEDESGRWSLWARGSRSSFSGREDALTLEGDVSTGVMGADYERGRILAGVALAYSAGEGSYTEADARGEVESTLLSAYPYLRYTLSERLSVWSVLGLGEGGLTLDMKANENANDEHIETDISLAMAAFGARGKLLSVAGYDLAVKTDVLFVRTESEAATGLAAADARTRRLRLTLEGSREVKLDGGVLTPSLEIGLRHDGGDAETGSGLELGGGLRWAGLKGFSVEVRARGLLAHEERDYEEWGVSASIGLSPGEGDRGLSMRVGSAWGAAAGGVERLWSQRALSGSSFDPDARLDAEVGYGLDAMRGLLTPYTGVALSEGGETWRAGARFRLGPALELNLEASLTEPDGDGETGSGLVLRGTKRW